MLEADKREVVPGLHPANVIESGYHTELQSDKFRIMVGATLT